MARLFPSCLFYCAAPSWAAQSATFMSVYLRGNTSGGAIFPYQYNYVTFDITIWQSGQNKSHIGHWMLGKRKGSLLHLADSGAFLETALRITASKKNSARLAKLMKPSRFRKPRAKQNAQSAPSSRPLSGG